MSLVHVCCVRGRVSLVRVRVRVRVRVNVRGSLVRVRVRVRVRVNVRVRVSLVRVHVRVRVSVSVRVRVHVRVHARVRARVPEALGAKREDGRIFEQPIESQVRVGGGLGPLHRTTHEPREETVGEEPDLIKVCTGELSRAVKRLESADPIPVCKTHG